MSMVPVTWPRVIVFDDDILLYDAAPVVLVQTADVDAVVVLGEPGTLDSHVVSADDELV